MMRAATALLLVLALRPTHARAEIAALGGLKLGQPYKKAAQKKVTLYGCAGNLYASADGDNKVVKVTFYGGRTCSAASVAAAVGKDFGGSAIANAAGDKLWEGATASVILTRTADRAPMLELVPHGAGSKRTCWPDDGFAPFWAAFKSGVASGKPDAVAASFAYPFAAADGTVKFKDAGDFAANWVTLINADDVKAIAGGKKAPACSIDDEHYTIYFAEAYARVTAVRSGDGWHWTSITFQSPD
jgi:hypothetical protein